MRRYPGDDIRDRRTAPSRRRWSVVATVLVALVAAACTPSASSAPPACVGPAGPPDAAASAILAATNADRAANGLGALHWEPQLWCLASEWSAQIVVDGSLHHRDLNSVIRSPEYGAYRTLGENLLRGPASLTADRMEEAWMASAGHRANILDGSFTGFAVASSTTADGQIYVTVNFSG